MQILVEAIRTQGKVLPGGFLKVDAFLNHQVLPQLSREMGEQFAAHFAPLKPSKIITVEASGIAPALVTALALDVPLVYARKKRPLTMTGPVYQGQTVSRTKGGAVDLFLSAEYLSASERVVVIDDFLASGHTLLTLAGMIAQSGAQLLGVGCVIEKEWEGGRAALAGLNIPIHTLANIVSLEPEFRLEMGR